MVEGVVITGLGIVGPTGTNKESFWNALASGRSVIRTISRFDASAYPSRIAGEVPDGFDQVLDSRHRRRLPLVSRFAVAATRLALSDAGLVPEWADPSRVGVILGTSLGAYKEAAEQTLVLHDRGLSRLNPFLTLSSYYHSTAGEVAIEAGAQGLNLTQTVGCPSALCAVGLASDFIRQGRLDICVTGGAEAPLFPVVFAGMCRAGELSLRNDHPEQASRPFDRSHDGIVLSEGSAILVLESMQSAMRRGARIYTEILGYAVGSEAHEMYGIEPTGDAAVRTLRNALRASRCSPDHIGYVSAHGNSCPRWDRKETLILKRALGEHAARVPISSIKGSIGHNFGAAGAFQLASVALSLEAGTCPPTANFEQCDPECDLSYFGDSVREPVGETILINNFGYGGVNSFMLTKRVI